MDCDVCKKEIEGGDPFTLSDLTKEVRLLSVCRTCAGSQWISIELQGIEIIVHKDDYIRADKGRLEAALDKAVFALDELGWECKAIKIEGKSDIITEEYEEF